MDNLVVIELICPKCKSFSKAVIEEEYRKFLIYTCPRCNSNVVYYNNKVEIISDVLLKNLMKQKKLSYCGDIVFMPLENELKKGTIIDDDKIADLKILLATESNIDKIISSL
jgi:transposase-like protein